MTTVANLFSKSSISSIGNNEIIEMQLKKELFGFPMRFSLIGADYVITWQSAAFVLVYVSALDRNYCVCR